MNFVERQRAAATEDSAGVRVPGPPQLEVESLGGVRVPFPLASRSQVQPYSLDQDAAFRQWVEDGNAEPDEDST